MKHSVARFVGPVLVAAAALVAGCGSDNGTPPQSTFTREQLLDPETCKTCHAKHYDEWSGSMHAYAATDPVFRAMNKRGQREKKLGDFCVNCHAPMAVREGATVDGTDLDSVPKKLQGVTCYFCHQVTDVAGTHNNPLVLANDTTMRGEFHDPAKNPAHIGAYSALHDSARVQTGEDMANGSKLCGACHDIVVPGHFSGATDAGVAGDVALERTFTEWQASLFSKPIHENPTPESCTACHSGRSEDVIAAGPGLDTKLRKYRHSHDFPGVDVALTDFPNKASQRDSVLSLLEQTMRIQLCVSDPKISPFGNTTVQIDNVSTGHNVPSGSSQDRRFWFELHAYDATGAELYSSGVVPPGTSVTQLEDKTTADLPDGALISGSPAPAQLRDVALDKDGKPAHMFWDVARIDQSDPRRRSLGTTITLLDVTSHQRAYPFQNPHPGKHPTRVTLTLHVQPIGRDVLDDLVASGDLSADDAGASVVDAVPTFDIIPNPGDGGVTNTLEWTPALAAPDGITLEPVIGDPQTCVTTGVASPVAPRNK
jgi:hypothetical protein